MEICRKRDAASIYVPLALVNFISSAVWAIYGLALGDWFVYGPNILGAALSAFQMALRAAYDRRCCGCVARWSHRCPCRAAGTVLSGAESTVIPMQLLGSPEQRAGKLALRQDSDVQALLPLGRLPTTDGFGGEEETDDEGDKVGRTEDTDLHGTAADTVPAPAAAWQQQADGGPPHDRFAPLA